MRTSVIILALCMLAACGKKKEESENTGSPVQKENLVTLTSAQFSSAGIVMDSIQEKTLSSIIKVNGKIDVPPQNMISISMPLGGYLKSTRLLPGMHVTKGEVIATLEDQQYIQLQQDYLTTQSKLAYAETEYLRQKELNQSKAVSDKVFQQAQMEYNTQKINLGALSEKLKLININPANVSAATISKSVNMYSPINGFVSRVNVNIGKYVTPADVLFELVNPSDIHLNLKIFEKDLDKLFIGQPLIAYTNNEPEKKYRCEINLISKDLSAERTADVHCHFEQYDKALIPGMYMNADIKMKSKKTPVLPESAVVNFEGSQFVFVALGNNRFQMTAVETGIKENGFIEISNSRYFSGKSVVTGGAYTLLMTLKNTSAE